MRPPEHPSRKDTSPNPQRRVKELPQPALTLDPLGVPPRESPRQHENTPENLPNGHLSQAEQGLNAELVAPSIAEFDEIELDADAIDEFGDPNLEAEANPQRVASQLQTMLQVNMSTGQWRKAVENLQALIDQEQDNGRRASYRFSVAVIVRDELQRPDLALLHFESALDDDPSLLKAFAAIDKILTQRRNWAVLERSYRKMIFRLPRDESQMLLLRLQLWRNLGEIYRTRMGDFQKALIAYQTALRMDPQDQELQTIVAELQSSQVPAPLELSSDELQAHLDAIAQRPSSTDSYRTLYRYYRGAKKVDRAYEMASILVAIRRANDEQERFFHEHRPGTFLDPERRPTPKEFDEWIRHPDQDPTLTAIFQLAAPAVGSLFARNPQEIPQMRNAWPTRDNLRHGHLMQAIEYAEAVLGVPSPRLYVNENESGGAQILALRDGLSSVPIVIAHQELVHTHQEPALAFAMVQSLAQLSAAHFAFVATGKSLKGLRELFYACLALSGVSAQAPSAVAARLVQRLRDRVDPAHLEQLRSLVRHCVGDHQARPVDLTKWIGASQLTLNRWALVMSGDLPAALSLLASQAEQGYSPVSRKQKMQDLVLYSISEHYRKVRQATGLI